MISVLIPYRNREIVRVKRCLDSLHAQLFADFEAILVDNGSDENISEEIKKATSSYPFCKYVFTNTRGLIWNRSYALNVGAQASVGDILMMADIDLIFEPYFLEKMGTLNFTGNFYNYRCIYLPEGYVYENRTWETFGNKKYRNSGNSRGLLVVSKKDFVSINGYDEYYQQWGVEDDDMDKRLKLSNLTQHYLNENEFVSLHQWHTESYTNFPTMWYIHMLNYCGENQEIKRNLNGFGKTLKIEDRVDFSKHQNQKNTIIPTKNLSITGFNEIIKLFFEKQANETILVSYKQPDDFKESGFIKKTKDFVLQYFIKNKHIQDQNAILARSYLTTEALYDFIAYFISINRLYISDYFIEYKYQVSLNVFIIRK